jgi:hypothetical protein
MKHTSLIPHPRFSPASPIVTARELILAAACCDLERQKMELTTEVTALKIRNAELNRALLRAHNAGHCALELMGLITTVAAVCSAPLWVGHVAGIGVMIGFILGIVFILLLLWHTRPHFTARRTRTHPSHLEEPEADARFEAAAARSTPPLGEAYADEPGFDPDAPVPYEILEPVPTHPEALTRQLNAQA